MSPLGENRMPNRDPGGPTGASGLPVASVRINPERRSALPEKYAAAPLLEIDRRDFQGLTASATPVAKGCGSPDSRNVDRSNGCANKVCSFGNKSQPGEAAIASGL